MTTQAINGQNRYSAHAAKVKPQSTEKKPPFQYNENLSLFSNSAEKPKIKKQSTENQQQPSLYGGGFNATF